ncbi:hypothetical protein L9F63_014032 [Diploptera punctata]|uniref:Cytochrome P450 n=1 Tax=Diploptera punctata TaxID=6984 RepID=A0AAD8AB48_DIPPU|nr:hypothetical protein L9F63_014032 [Diploptera punctata]
MLALPVLIALVLITLVTLYKYYKKHAYTARLINQIPGPPALPIVGNTIEINVEHDELFERMMGSTKLWGRRLGINREWLGNKPYVLVFHPDRLEPILSSSKHIEKSGDYLYLHPWLGTGLLTSSGLHAYEILTPTFHFKILEDFIGVFLEQSAILVEKLKKEVDNDVGFNIFPYVTLCTLDIVCDLSTIHDLINAQSDSESDYVKAIYEIGSIVQNRQAKIWLQPDCLFRLTSLFKKHEKCIAILHGFSNKVIRERKEELRRNESNKNSSIKNEDEDLMMFGRKKRLAFLDLLIEASKNGTILSDEDIREEVDTFMNGHDTTSAAISWTLFLLGGHPEIQDIVVEELNDILGSDVERRFTMKDLLEMKYLECCIKEALRLYPSVPMYGRRLTEDVKIAQYTIPSGTTALIMTYMLHRNTEIYPQPEKYDPDRFLPHNVMGRHPYAYIPFSAGPRNCIGQKFAILEEKAVLASVLRKYRVEAVDRRENLTLLGELILRPKNGLKIKIFPR